MKKEKRIFKEREKEAIERWGERVESSIELWKSYTEDQKEYVIQAMQENYIEIARLMNAGAARDSSEVQNRVRMWHEQLHFFYEPSIEMLKGLGTMYKEDSEFRQYYEAIDPNLPDFIAESVLHYADVLAARWIEEQELQLKE